MAELRIHERPDLINPDRAARMLGVTATTVRNHILAGLLGAERVEGRYYLRRVEIEALAKARLGRATAAAK